MIGYIFSKVSLSFSMGYMGFFLSILKFHDTSPCDPDEMLYKAAFHLGLHCPQTTRLGVSGLQRAKLSVELIWLLQGKL